MKLYWVRGLETTMDDEFVYTYGIFSTLEKANAIADTIREHITNTSTCKEEVDVEEIIVDKPLDVYYHVISD